ncbi:MAG TPA: ribosome maturation factor RimP [Trueperaceae bacterium]|nr:ribosome maturation factor RimP [Trueperaceae bacterium]
MELAQAADDVLAPLGFEVLECTTSESGRQRRVLLRIDRLDEHVVSVDDVAKAAEVFGLELDRLDPFEEPYRLEVESPGPKRPLLRERHFQRFHDLLAKVRVRGETFTGRIREVSQDTVTFEVNGEARVVRMAAIQQARLAEWPDEPR